VTHRWREAAVRHYRNDNVGHVALFGDHLQSGDSVCVAHDIIENARTIFLNPWQLCARYTAPVARESKCAYRLYTRQQCGTNRLSQDSQPLLSVYLLPFCVVADHIVSRENVNDTFREKTYVSGLLATTGSESTSIMSIDAILLCNIALRSDYSGPPTEMSG